MFCSYLYYLYKIPNRILRYWIRRQVGRLEKGEIYSVTLRRIFRVYYDVEIGLYTHGACFVPSEFDRFTKIGRYCSVARGARVMNANHPVGFKSTHGFFFNASLGHCSQGLMEYQPLVIGNDVWLGTNALILPQVKHIANGAVIAAGSVVGRDVPPYAIVVGNPARIVRFRFSPEVIEQLLASKWWEKPIDELPIDEFTRPFEPRSKGEPADVV